MRVARGPIPQVENIYTGNTRRVECFNDCGVAQDDGINALILILGASDTSNPLNKIVFAL